MKYKKRRIDEDFSDENLIVLTRRKPTKMERFTRWVTTSLQTLFPKRGQ